MARIGNVALGGAVIGIILFWIGMMIFWPIIVIWAMNTLFGFSIAYTFTNWIASLVLCATVKASVRSPNSK